MERRKAPRRCREDSSVGLQCFRSGSGSDSIRRVGPPWIFVRHALDAKRILWTAELVSNHLLDVAERGIGDGFVVEVEHHHVDRAIRAAPRCADVRDAVGPNNQFAFPPSDVDAITIVDRLQLPVHAHVVREGMNVEATDANATFLVPAPAIDYDGLTSRWTMLCGRGLAQAQPARAPKSKAFVADDGVDDVRDEHARDHKHILGKRKPVA
jgi:hypothetical protein